MIYFLSYHSYTGIIINTPYICGVDYLLPVHTWNKHVAALLNKFNSVFFTCPALRVRIRNSGLRLSVWQCPGPRIAASPSGGWEREAVSPSFPNYKVWHT